MSIVRGLAAFSVLVLTLVGCSEPPTAADDEQPTTAGTGPTEAPEAAMDFPGEPLVQELYAELEGLSKEDRRQHLIEAALEEGGEVSFYAATNYDDVTESIETFEDQTDVSISHYRGDVPSIVRRIEQELAAGYTGFDVVVVRGLDCHRFESEGLLLTLDTPLAENMVEGVGSDYWLPIYINARMVGWNRDLISEPPASWEEVLTQYPGQLHMDTDYVAWFAALVEQHFMEELGMAKDEAVELFKEASRNGTLMRGSTLASELTLAGDIPIHTTLSHHNMPHDDPDAPLEWEPPVEPVVVEPICIAMFAGSERVASALLLTEFMLDEGQQLLANEGRTPGSTAVDGGFPESYRTINVDPAMSNEELAEWEALWNEVIDVAGERLE